MKMDGRGDVAVAVFADGVSSRGACQEAMNLAVVKRLPNIFSCQNNQLAISTTLDQGVSRERHRKAEGFGMSGVLVDGNDKRPVGKARLVRAGTDMMIIARGFMVRKALQLAKTLKARGISAHILDLRTIAPLDEPALADAAAQTGRVVILSQAVSAGGNHHTIAGWIAQHCFNGLRGPIQICSVPQMPVFPVSTNGTDLRL